MVGWVGQVCVAGCFVLQGALKTVAKHTVSIVHTPSLTCIGRCFRPVGWLGKIGGCSRTMDISGMLSTTASHSGAAKTVFKICVPRLGRRPFTRPVIILPSYALLLHKCHVLERNVHLLLQAKTCNLCWPCCCDNLLPLPCSPSGINFTACEMHYRQSALIGSQGRN